MLTLGEIVLSNDTVQSMLIAAGYLGCEPIIEATSEFIQDRINVENVLEVIQVADSLSCANLRLIFIFYTVSYGR